MAGPQKKPPLFKEEDGDMVYLRDVNRLVGTRAMLNRRELSGEIITSPEALKVR